MSNRLRESNVGLLCIGLYSRHIVVPPGTSDYTVGGSCPPPVTEAEPFANTNFMGDLFEGFSERVYAMFFSPHMHKYGTQAWVERYNANGTFKSYLGTIDP